MIFNEKILRKALCWYSAMFLLAFVAGFTVFAESGETNQPPADIQNWADMVSPDITFENGVYKIYCPEELALMAKWVNSECSADQNYELMNNVDLKGRKWTPIGSSKPALSCETDAPRKQRPFKGMFEGNNFHIRTLFIDGLEYGAFFEVIGPKATVKNLIIDYATVTATHAAGFAVENQGTILRCDAFGSIKNKLTSAFFVINNLGRIEKCSVGGNSVEDYNGRNGPKIFVHENKGVIIGKDRDTTNDSLYWRCTVSPDITFDNGVYKIYCPEELALMAKWVNSECSADQSYELMNDIDLKGRKWTPIGKSRPDFTDSSRLQAPRTGESLYPSIECPFQGILEGNNFAIRNLYFRDFFSSGGLFEVIGAKATVQNITLEDVEVYARPGPAFAVKNKGTVIGCQVTGYWRLTSGTTGGVFISRNWGRIEKCYVYKLHGKVEIENFVGINRGTIIN